MRGRPRKDAENNTPEIAASSPREESGRRKRASLGAPRLKLQAEKRDGYVRRFINDIPGRLILAQESGWEFVNEPHSPDEDSRTKRYVGTHEGGAPMYAYLMEIRQEFYDEDQAEKMAKLDEFDAALRRGNPTGVDDGEKRNFYTPSEGVSLRHS